MGGAKTKNTAKKKGQQEPAANGSSAKTKKTANQQDAASSNAASPLSLGVALLIAFVAFAFGILTPPLWQELQSPSSSSNHMNNAVMQRRAESQQPHGGGAPQKYPCTDELLVQFWHEQEVPGLHIVCFDMDERFLYIKYYRGAAAAKEEETTVHTLDLPVAWPTLRSFLAEHLQLQPADDMRQPWALFSPEGERILDELMEEKEDVGFFSRELASFVGTTLLFQGGQFLWPGVRIGFKREIALYSIMPARDPIPKDTNWTVTLETLSLTPLVLSVEGFLSESECQHIREVAEPTMKYSGVVLHDSDAGRPASDFRTSKTTFVSANDEILLDIDYRTASLTRIPRRHQETVQVLRYGETERYTSHHDYFDPGLYQKDPNTLSLIGNGRRNRLATVFWYLSDVAEGGETVFPRFNGGRERNFDDCETGLLVKPQTGKVIIFYSLRFDGSRDTNSLHGACPVRDGVKWAANKWIWNEEMRYVPA